MRTHRAIVGALVLTLSAAAPALADPAPAGGEFVVNTTTTNATLPSIAALPGGGFVVVWADNGIVPRRVRGQRCDSSGLPVGIELEADSTLTNRSVDDVEVAADPAGSFVIAWRVDYGVSDKRLLAQRFDASGVGQGADFFVADDPSAGQQTFGLAKADDGSFVLAWEHGSPPVLPHVLVRRFDAAGQKLGTEFLADSATAGSWEEGPDVGIDASGNFIVAWSDATADGAARGIVAQRFDAGGTPVGTQFVVNSYTTGAQYEPSVSVDDDGSFVVMWKHQARAWVRAFDSSAQPIGADLMLPSSHGNTDAELSKQRGSDELVVVWHAGVNSIVPPTDGSGRGAFAQRISRQGQPLGTEFPLNFHRVGHQIGPAVAFQSADRFVTAWSTPSTAIGPTILAQRYCDEDDPSCDRCVGFDDAVDVDADGVPDGCDRCVDLAGTSTLSTKPRLFITRGGDAKISKYRLQGEGVLPIPFSALAPDTDGVRLSTVSAFWGEILDVVLPGQAFGGGGTEGWKRNGSGTTWTYLDKTGADTIAGIRKVQLKDRSSKVPGTLRIKVTGRRGTYPLQSFDVPPVATMVFGDETASAAGLCLETAFAVDDCRYVESNERVSCK